MKEVGDNIFGFDFEQITDNFAMGLTRETALVAEWFGGQQVVQIEFETKIPWVMRLEEAE